MKLIDTHAHLYVEEFGNDIQEIINKAKQNQVHKILLPNIDFSSSEKLLNLWKSDKDFFEPMMGLHPCSVNKKYKEELEKLFSYFSKEPIKIVGEIGLDYYWSTEFKTEQIEAFKWQINFAKENNFPIAVHCRNSFDDILNILEEEQDGNLKGVLHCFSGNIEQAHRLINLGFYLGIGGVLTFKNSGLDKVIANVDLEHLILETDAPYLAPTPFRGKRNESSYVKLVAEKLATIKNKPIEEVAEQTTKNAKQLFPW